MPQDSSVAIDKTILQFIGKDIKTRIVKTMFKKMKSEHRLPKLRDITVMTVKGGGPDMQTNEQNKESRNSPALVCSTGI